ncbi:MAG: FAD-dependent oxidoreductase [Terriglobia bacterium]
MKRNLDALSSSQFDLAVIGGGVNGASVAREAALRGLKVALLEAADFASGTSSRSSKLIHGGLRYLAQGELRLVREARLERRLLARLAPHLVEPLPFLLPIYRGDRFSPLKLRVGLSIYDWLGNLGAEDRHRFLSGEQTLRMAPALRADGLRAGAIYHDSLTDDARLCFECALDAAAHGAVAANYAAVCGFRADPATKRISHAEVVDAFSGKRYEIAARFWINAAGPWVDRVRALAPEYDGSKTIRLTKGTHVILPRVTERFALFGAIPPGERVFLMMPWHGHSLLGTTDTEYDGDPAAVEPDRADVEYLLAAPGRVLAEPLKTESVIGSYAGLRALVRESGKKPSANTREYRFHRDPWAANLISICGGKLTTARAMGEKLVDLAVSELPGLPGEAASNPSRATPFPGGHLQGARSAFVDAESGAAVREYGIPRDAAERVVRTYGSRWRQALEPARGEPSLLQPLRAGAGFLGAEIVFSIREEMALKLEDFLLRRSGLSWMICAYPETAGPVADVFARELCWSAEERQTALDRFERLLHRETCTARRDG